MQNDIRETGIKAIGAVEWGTHLCQLYQDRGDLLEILLPYFQTGIDQGEYCIWIVTAPLTKRAAEQALGQRVVDLAERIQRGQVTLISHSDWYLSTGHFDPNHLSHQWAWHVERAQKDGYPGIRVAGTGDKASEIALDDLIEYERQVNTTISDMRMIALCSYCLNEWQAEEIADIVNSHQRTILRRNGKWTVIESAERQKILRLLGEKQDHLDLLQTAMASVANGVLITAVDGKVLWMNRSCEQLSGYSLEESLGKTPGALFASGVTPPEVYQDLWTTIKAGSVWQGEIVNRRKDGSLYHEEMTITPVKNNGSGISHFIAVKQDITERHHADQAIRESEQRYRALFEETRRHAAELEAVAQVSQALRSASKRDEMIEVVLHQLISLLHAEGASLTVHDRLTDDLVIEKGVGGAEKIIGLHFPIHPSITGQVISTATPFRSDSLAKERDLAYRGQMENIAAACVPLIKDGQVTGAFWVSRQVPFTDSDFHLLLAITDIAANALHRVALFEETAQAARRMETINRVGREISETLSLPEIFNRLSSAIAELLPELQSIQTFSYDAAAQTVSRMNYLEDGFRVDDLWQKSVPLDLVDHTLRAAIQTQSIVERSTRSAAHDIVEDQNTIRAEQSALDVPILFKNKVQGIILVTSRPGSRITQAEGDLLSLLATTASIAIENARLFAETQLRLDRLATLHSIDKAINSSLDLDMTLRVLLEHVTMQLKVDAAGILICDPITQRLEYAAGRGFRTYAYSRSRVKIGEGIDGDVARTHDSIFLERLPENESEFHRCHLLRDEDFVSYAAVPLVSKGQVKGILEIFHRSRLHPDAEWRSFFEALAAQAVIAVDNATLFKDIQKSHAELEGAYDTTLMGWMRTLELRDDETEGHTQRVTELAIKLARAMGLTKTEMIQIRRGSLLHDIGKIGIPDSILRKPGPLTDEEWVTMKQHPVMAYRLLEPIDYLRSALDIPYCHHERWDGSGYPRGLKGKDIPLAARIFAVADVWDALLSDRPYRSGWPEEKALQFLIENAGVLFDPHVVNAFMTLNEEERRPNCMG